MSAPKPALREVADRPLLVWRCARPWLAVSSAPRGGGIGLRSWVLNATVETDYDHPDPPAHIDEMAGAVGLSGDGVGLLTAVDVRHEVSAFDGGVQVSVTTGAQHPIWAAEPESAQQLWAPGTINAVCWSPVRLSEAALVNAVATVAEAKAQALLEAGVAGTGTVTDATVVLCPADGEAEPYGGPRSRIGAPLARAVHAAVTAGLRVEHPRHG
ncbi:adenosylcobinamide amidohydrolase [Saccharopolyspora subtropica]|uniref:Adenosylcobinamide amidohydrolase n=1 Tax=Saccharopolyspora thermophila TaxID=89367 RepID=A0A917JMF7_9PSEU|nr:adenosylcobinamide amidohydrolase [Saccharopolyspora subtropica]GGI77316.1 adenosylcobinamide amidohydrolase [Saccharopolyspora subtropica]